MPGPDGREGTGYQVGPKHIYLLRLQERQMIIMSMYIIQGYNCEWVTMEFNVAAGIFHPFATGLQEREIIHGLSIRLMSSIQNHRTLDIRTRFRFTQIYD